MNKHILYLVNVDWFFISHRLCIAQRARELGWEVTVMALDTGRSNEITQCGIQFINIPLIRSGTNPFKEISTIIKIYKIYNDLKPDVVHHITLKPVIYGSLIAKLNKIKGVLNAISGLGYNFTEGRKSKVAMIMIALMKRGFNRENLAFIFQNQDDYRELDELGVLYENNKVSFIKGSGVNLDKFSFSLEPESEPVKILFPVRMLWDKGAAELRAASDLLKAKYQHKIQFILVGLADDGNKAGVSAAYLQDWQDGDYVKWIGYQTDMPAIYKDSHIVVLPSYREGMPKTLIEACAVGRPIVTTNAIGCRECVDEGKNGYKVPVKSIDALAEALEKLIVNKQLRVKMGKYSREKAVAEFDQKQVIQRHIELYNDLYSYG